MVVVVRYRGQVHLRNEPDPGTLEGARGGAVDGRE